MTRKMNTVSRQEYYDNIIEAAAYAGGSSASWAQCPTKLQRALAFANTRLQSYKRYNDQVGIDDTQYVIDKIKKEMKR